MEDNKKREGDRDLSVLEYFKELQKEYFAAEIRSKIYSKMKDKKYFRDRVMVGKEIVIKDIAKNNHLPSIFTSKKEYYKVRNLVYGERGYPNFEYKNESFRSQFGEKDLFYYFYKGSEVRVYDEEEKEETLGIIKNVNLKAELVEVMTENNQIIVSDYSKVTRIL